MIRAVYEESKILLKRRDISDILTDSDTAPDIQKKLQLVLKTRSFSETIGLEPKKSFTQYSAVDRDPLAWVLVGAKPTSFELYSWWFPIVGNVPYKAYFTKDGVIQGGKFLEYLGYETWIRTTDAFSTLGWFNDPILSTTLKRSDSQIVNLVIHETVHSTIWIKNHVDFNESLANFIGTQGTVEFYERELKLCSDNDQPCKDGANSAIKLAAEDLERETAFAELITDLYTELNKLYSSDKSNDEKLTSKNTIFNQKREQFLTRYPSTKFPAKLNNAWVIQLKLYLTGLDLFRKLYDLEGRDCKRFLPLIKEIKDRLERKTPFCTILDLIHKREPSFSSTTVKCS